MEPWLERWQPLYDAFDPWAPARGAQRADRGEWSPITRLSKQLARPLGPRKMLLLGTQGSGKTTELLRLAEERSDRYFVVYLDLWRHLQEKVGDAPAIERLQPWEVVQLAGLAVHRAGREALGITWPREQETALADAITLLHADPSRPPATLDLAKLAGGLLVLVGVGAASAPVVAAGAAAVATTAVATTAGMALGSGLKELAGALKWELPVARRGAPVLDSQDPVVRRLIDAVNALVGTIQSTHKPILLVLDGLDRVTRPEGVRRLFVESAVLSEIAASTLVTASLTLRRPGYGAAVRGWNVEVMYSVPVLDHAHPADPAHKGPGMAFFRELVRLRHPDAHARLPEAQVDRLAWASGGLIRDFCQLVQEAVTVAVERDLLEIDAAAAEAAIDTRRRQMEGVSLLTLDDLDRLADVARSHELPHGENMNGLIEGFCVLPYPNESDWWHPHPLLTMVKLRDRIGFGG